MRCAQAVSFAIGESKLKHKTFCKRTTIARANRFWLALIAGVDRQQLGPEDGKIKAQGPSLPKRMMVQSNFRDPLSKAGP